jgi:hypothetical protein
MEYVRVHFKGKTGRVQYMIAECEVKEGRMK